MENFGIFLQESEDLNLEIDDIVDENSDISSLLDEFMEEIEDEETVEDNQNRIRAHIKLHATPVAEI